MNKKYENFQNIVWFHLNYSVFFFIIILKCLLDTLSKLVFYLIKRFTEKRVKNAVIYHYQVSIHNYKLCSVLYEKLSEDC